MDAGALEELVEGLANECGGLSGTEETRVAEARICWVASEVCGGEFTEPRCQYRGARGWLLFEDTIRQGDPHLVEEIELAVERFDEWWQRLCEEPADDTEPEPEEETMVAKRKFKEPTECTARIDEAGETRWTCPQCQTEHHGSKRVCGCDYVRPPIHKLLEQLKSTPAAGVPETQLEAAAKETAIDERPGSSGVGLVNGEAAWQCRRCQRMNPAEANACSCASEKPGPIAEVNGHGAAMVHERTDPEGRATESFRLPGGSFLVIDLKDIDVKLIDLRKDNPRKQVDDDELQQLAKAIDAVGLQNRVVLRLKIDGRYELWQGERRLRAHRDVLKRKTVAARIYPAMTPDWVMVRGRFDENEARSDLNPIERAIGLQQLLDSGACKSQRELAESVGLSQGEISLRLGLLKLPQEWQQRVIAGAISGSCARHLAPWIETPAVLEWMADSLKQAGDDVTENHFKNLIDSAIRNSSKEVTGDIWTGNGTTVRLSKAQLADPRLDVREVKIWNRKEKRAFNVDLWQEFVAAAKAKRAERQGSSEGKSGSSQGEPSAAQKRVNAKKKAEQWNRRLYRYKVAWLVTKVKERIGLGKLTDPLLLKLLLTYCCAPDQNERDDGLQQAIEGHNGKTRKGFGDVSYESLGSLPLDRISSVARSAVARWIEAPFDGWRPMLTPEDIEALARDLGVSFDEWVCDREFLELHSKDQLAALATEWKRTVDYGVAGDKRGQKVDALLQANTNLRLPAPKELVNCKPIALR